MRPASKWESKTSGRLTYSGQGRPKVKVMVIRRGKTPNGDYGRAAKALIAGLVGVTIAAASFSCATAAIRITSDNGGPMGHYMKMFMQIRDSGESVMIDGNCMSACTLVLALVPRNRICVTPNARLGFHATWSPDDQGNGLASASTTQALMELYPRPIRQWIRRHGGLTEHMIVLAGPELMTMYRSCPLPQ
jgi:hypothetical protein